MPHVFLPPFLQPLVHHLKELEVDGTTVRNVIENLELQYPGVKNRLVEANHLKLGLTVVVNGTLRTKGLREKVNPNDEIHFLPLIGGG